MPDLGRSAVWQIEQQPHRQDSLAEQLATVWEAATRLGCYDAADWLWKNGRPLARLAEHTLRGQSE